MAHPEGHQGSEVTGGEQRELVREGQQLLSLYSLASSQADWLEVCLAYTNVMHALSTLAGAVVHQLQTEIASLPDPSDPQQVLHNVAIYTTMYILYYVLHRVSGQPVLEGYCMHAWAGYIDLVSLYWRGTAWGRLLGYQAIDRM